MPESFLSQPRKSNLLGETEPGQAQGSQQSDAPPSGSTSADSQQGHATTRTGKEEEDPS